MAVGELDLQNPGVNAYVSTVYEYSGEDLIRTIHTYDDGHILHNWVQVHGYTDGKKTSTTPWKHHQEPSPAKETDPPPEPEIDDPDDIITTLPGGAA